ncbi:MAG TPA: hypothetical protein VK956_14665, partial [Verrucomicrobium sp.]|nr:hypothetical protein [Verrucomicrobium sp.]
SLAVASMLFGRHIRNGPDVLGKMPETARKMRTLPSSSLRRSSEGSSVVPTVQFARPLMPRH